MNSATLGEWSRLLFGTLARCGVSDAIISPGSRSTPFAWAALHTPGLRCHSIVDERSAAFFALGQARVSGRPSVVLCTSGSAAAEYFSAVVEAALGFVPLLLLTADRPFELMDCGAAQVMDQSNLYGKFARHFVELGQPEASASALDGLVRRVAQAAQLSRSPLPGPVQLNARARKPLEPVTSSRDEDRALAAEVERRLQRGPALALSATESAALPLSELAARMDSVERGLLVCGPLPLNSDATALLGLARASGFALYAETTSQARHQPDCASLLGAAGPLLLSRGDALLEPELVVQFGAAPSSIALERWLSCSSARQVIVSEHGWLNPANRAELLVRGAPAVVAARLAEQLGAASSTRLTARRAYSERLRRADAVYWSLLERELTVSAALTEASAVRAALSALPSDALLGVGNSLVIRDVDDFVAPERRPLAVWSQRGLNGIDGLVSGAAGAAKSAARPSLLLLGDVSFLHDIGGLAAARELDSPLALVVIDNAGGQIFEDLPVARLLADEPELKSFWLTPPRVELAHAAALYGLPYVRPTSVGELRTALELALQRRGATLIHAAVAPDSARRLRERLRAQLPGALAEALK